MRRRSLSQALVMEHSFSQEEERARIAKLALEQSTKKAGAVVKPEPIGENPNRVNHPSTRALAHPAGHGRAP
jgi:hypothetical protein